ncbi:MAG: ABC transporter permease [Firmicutes bacterium]|jgi:peptide/nickel transport system permease protein|uniref:ABC transporter permease n=1 Tax=Sulfobacillus benefaciens TaxID=453960 RepID=A0A2T2X4H5_9FIRM|nr:ABC transporter permease [Bacillota bacterium]MCL5013726.1 ABC transporter permease [Bacillota bacterium]PSR29400.1 MAG: ABC transporter permease [Sulfobacillus benefaciens]
MMKYALARAVQAVPTLLLLSIISFVLIHVVPGGPAVVMLGDKATPALIAQINRSLGLNKPLWVQYLIWLEQLLRGNLGYAYSYHQTVASLILTNLPRTLILVVSAIAISHVLAVIIGIYQAVHRDQPVDHALTALLYFLYAMPTFWLGVLMVSMFSINLGWFPSGGLYNPLLAHPTLASYMDHLVLPASVLIIGSVAGWGRYMRSSMAETLVQDYIRTARAKGLSERAVLVHHALKNSLLPLITLVGMSLPSLFSGALIIEIIFDYPGMGLLFWNAAQQRDYPILLGIVIMVGVLTIVGNLLADILYAVVDPRIQYQ